MTLTHKCVLGCTTLASNMLNLHLITNPKLRVHKLRYMYPWASRGAFAYLKDTFEGSNRREKYVYTLFISKYLYIHQ